MSRKIQDIEGIGPTYSKILVAQGISTSDDLLETCGSRKGRKELAKNTSLSESNILKWVNMCDLFRINGVASQFAELLEGSGIDTIKELRTRNAENLAEKMKQVNNKKHLCKMTPSANTITQWIEQAKDLQPMVSY